MKTNTTLKIIALCVICAATLMSGCMESDDTKSTVLFDVDLVLTRHVGTGVMDVNLNEDGSATIVRITGTSDDIVETGEWAIYRTTSDGTLYDISTDDTELRIKMEDDGHAIANIYENGFKKCGESFYGTWEQMMEETTDDEPTTEDEPTSAIISNVIDSIAEDSTESLTNSHSGNLPVTVMVDHPNAGMVQITLEKDGSAEVCTPEYDGNCDSGKWVLVEETSTSVSYDVTDCVGADFVITLFNNGYATGDNRGVKLKGSWEKGIDGSEGGSSTQDSSVSAPNQRVTRRSGSIPNP